MLAFWQNEFDKYSAWLRSEAISPILNKVGQFLVNLPLRNIIGQSRSTINLKEIMDGKKILIANLSKGKIGEDNTSLLGSLLLTEIWLTALGRAEIPEVNRTPFYLYVDEFHSFVTSSFADILSESRKYHLSLTVSHQHLLQIDEKVRAAIFGNVGSIISFRVGAEDAEYLAREFHPFKETDFTNLPNYHIYLRLMINGVTSQPFSATTLALEAAVVSHSPDIMNESRRQYGKSRQSVERAILSRTAVIHPELRTDEKEKTGQHRLL